MKPANLVVFPSDMPLENRWGYGWTYKRLTEPELAAMMYEAEAIELLAWCMRDVSDRYAEMGEVFHHECEVLGRFAYLPHYDEETA